MRLSDEMRGRHLSSLERNSVFDSIGFVESVRTLRKQFTRTKKNTARVSEVVRRCGVAKWRFVSSDMRVVISMERTREGTRE